MTLEDVARGIARRLPGPARRTAEGWLNRPPPPGQFALPDIGVDPDASRCFVVPNGLAVSGVRVNLAGREPRGLVQAGEVAGLVAGLREALLELREERTGLPLVRSVVRTGDLHQGPNLDLLPDILVEWNDALSIGSAVLDPGPSSVISATSPRIGNVRAMNTYQRTGEHRADGLLVAAGPGITPGGADLDMSILDVAPTLTAALGVPFASAEGHVVAQLLPVQR